MVSNYNDFNKNQFRFLQNSIYISENSHMDKCKSCEFLVTCNGGCKFQHFINNAPLCRKNLLEEELPYLLELLYLGEFTNEGNFKRRKTIY